MHDRISISSSVVTVNVERAKSRWEFVVCLLECLDKLPILLRISRFPLPLMSRVRFADKEAIFCPKNIKPEYWRLQFSVSSHKQKHFDALQCCKRPGLFCTAF